MPVAELSRSAHHPPATPPGASSFLGRDRQLAELAGLLGRVRLVTLSGPPGIGKSRLARELVRGLAAADPARATFVELASVREGGLAETALASALAVQEAPGRGLEEAVIARLRRGRRLLVLDNCEHLLATCARLATVLLDGCPELLIVATSREPLGVPAEVVWPVPPLAVPAPAELSSAQDIVGYPSVRLFADRASVVEPRFALNPYVAPAVAQICRRLDGIPLAIELAAARIARLTPAEIARRLDDRFGLLSRADGAGQARHRTLEAALELSWDLLSAPEQALLARASVFSGAFDAAASEEVCGDEDAHAGLLEGLVSKSLVVREPAAGRYRLLETIRAYAGDRLEQRGETAALREAHASFYLALAEEAEPELTGPAQEPWFERLEVERSNLRAAFDWSVGHGYGEWALRLAGSLVLFWRVRCHFSEGREMLEAALGAGDRAVDPGLEARALWGAGFLAHWMGDDGPATCLSEQSLSCFEALGHQQGRARALLTLGGCTRHEDADRALERLEQSAALASDVGDRWCFVHALGAAGFARLYRGDGSGALDLFERCVVVAREAQDKQILMVPLVGLGQAALARGDYDTAEPLFAEAMAVAHDIGDDYNKYWALQHLGTVIARHDGVRSRRLLDAALDLIREVRPADLIMALVGRARLACGDGDYGLARRLLEESLTLARTGAQPLATALIGMAELEAQAGDMRAARRLHEEALDLARREGAASDASLALHALGDLARQEGERKRATVLHSEALEARARRGDAHGMVNSVEAVGGLAAEAGRGERAALLLGAADALRSERGFHRSRAERARYEADVELARQALPGAAFSAAFGRGRRLSLDDAVAKACNGRTGNGRHSCGWPSLTDAERQVATLVAEGLTNTDIGERLFISLGTVKDHMTRIFAKLGITARTELAREVGRQDHQGSGGAE